VAFREMNVLLESTLKSSCGNYPNYFGRIPPMIFSFKTINTIPIDSNDDEVKTSFSYSGVKPDHT
jgi:hypothetical protein